MRTLNEELTDIENDNTIIGAKPPKIRTMFDVIKTGNYTEDDFKKTKEFVAPEYESDLNVRIRAGITRGVQDIKNIPQGVEIFGGQVAMKIGGWADSEETVEMGRSLIRTAMEEQNAKEKKFYQSAIPLSSKDYQSLSFGLGQGITNYGAMLATGYLGGVVAGIGSMAVMEGSQKAQEKMDYYTEKTGDVELKGYTPEQAGKDAMLTTLYTAGSAILEKKLGYGAQRKLFKMPIGEKVKNVALTSLSEGGTETLQELYAIGIDFWGGYIDTSKLPERFIGAVQEGVIGGILGGTAGIAAAVNHRSQAKQILRENLKNTVPAKDLENVVNAVYESTSDSMSNIITQELAQSEQLRNKHGAIYDSLKAEIGKQIETTGAYSSVDEMKLSQYIEGNARKFADQVLGEANKRGVVIDDVMKSSEIVFQDGKLYLQGVSQQTKLKRLKEKKIKEAKQPSLLQFIKLNGGIVDESGELKNMDAAKQYIGLVNKNGTDIDTMGESLWQAGYFIERPTPAEVLDFIDDELKGVKHYPLGYVEQKSVSQAENEAMLDSAISEYAEIMDYDISKMGYDEKVEIYEQMQKNLNALPDEEITESEDLAFADNEFFQVADENARLDDIYPEYKGETITINGKERTVYNSNGDRIAKSKEALENFYKWFGDSKVVDEQGRPLVVYHGTEVNFNIFKGSAFNFTRDRSVAQTYGNKIVAVYLKSNNNIEIDFDGRSAVYFLGKLMNPQEIIDKIIEIKSDINNHYNIDDEVMEELKNLGFEEFSPDSLDGIVFKNVMDNFGLGGKSSENYVVFNPNQIKSTSNRGTYSESENIYYQFAGEKAKTAALNELNRAKQLEADGVDNEEIRQQTGWFKGADGKWRFEISDKDAKITLENAVIRVMNELLQSATEAQITHPNNEYLKKEIIDYNQKLKNLELFGNDYAFDYLKENGSLNTTLGEILSHNKLYSAYPDLKNMKIEFRDGLEGSAVGAYNPYKNSIALDIDYVKTPRKLKSVLLHEIQHAIQHIENFATGGNLSSFDSIAFRERAKYQEHMRNLLFKAIKDKFGKGIEFDYWDIVSMEGMENPSVFFDEYDLNGINRKELSNFIKETLPSLNEKMDEYKKDVLTRVPKNGVEFYKRLFGEVEARNTQARMNMTDAQRKAATPESTQDIANADAIIVFDDGTAMAYEPETYYQSAFAGSRVDYDRPSLEAIGSGEGAQAHGWGLYYALNRNVAEDYRKRFVGIENRGKAKIINKKTNEEITSENNFDIHYALTRIANFNRDLNKGKKEYIKFLDDELENNKDDSFVQEETSKILEIVKKLSVDDYKVEGLNYGQVHEVDIPENPYLLDEQKNFNEQSDFVKQAINRIALSMDRRLNETKLRKLTGDKPTGSSEENWKTYYAKRAWRAGKDFVIAEIHNNHDGDIEQELTSFIKDLNIEDISDRRNFDDYTGGEIYRELDNYYGSQKAASQKLEEYGIKGITYEGRRDGRCFVIFNPADVKVIQKFYQIKNLPKQKGKIKGAFDALTKSIEITSEADFSTYQHEMAHYWLDNIWNYAQSGKASERYMKQFNEIKKWLGVKPEQQYLTRQQHEKFARGYEKYLYKGEFANPIIGDTYKEYENFIREVYDSIAEIDTRAGAKYKPVPKVVYDFFNSMVSGTLPYYGGIEEPKEVVEKENKEVKEYVKEEQKTLQENTENYILKPVQTDTETGYLTAYKKMTGEEVEAGKVKLESELEKAEKFINENPEQAKRIVDGVEQVPEGMLKNTIYLAYDKLQKKLGNTENRAQSLMNQALELRRMGQEISSQRLAYKDASSPLYWIQSVQESKASALADSNNMKISELSNLIDKSIKEGMKQGKTAKEIAKDLREQLNVTEFYQEEMYKTYETDEASYNYIYKYVNQQLGLSLTEEQAEIITRKADDMLASLENSMAENGNPSVEYFVKEKDLENYANSIAPSSQARIMVSVVGRANLLFSIKSPMTNIVSNTFVGIYRAAVRRIMLGQYSSIVNPELIKQNKKYSWEIFRKTGYNVNNITPETPRNTILGEKLTHSEGEGNIRKLGRFYENLIYKWSLGAGDVVFKDYAFTDYIALKATKESGGDVKKANEIFKDASLIDPQTELGKEIRAEAIQESLIATYQNKGLISEKALKARESMDFGVGFGEFIAPFVKTPANVVSMGLKAGFGSVKAIASEIQRDLKAGKIQKPTRENIDLVVQNGLGLLLASIMLAFIDDDDYMPPYALATNKDKQMAKELNIAYNAVRVGNTWVSLDYLGPLASPLVGLLQARREDGILNTIFGYTKSGAIQSLSIPAFGNIADIFSNIQNMVRKEGADVAAQTLDDTMQAVYSRSVPSILSDIAKMLDRYDRETKGHEIKSKIPFVRETLPKKVNVTSGRAESLDNPIQELLFGARAKTQVVNSVAKELQRLNSKGYGVSLTPVTQRGKLSTLNDSTKEKVRVDFAKEYSKAVDTLIKTPSYKRMDDEDKQQTIDKIRRKTIESLKKRYLKN